MNSIKFQVVLDPAATKDFKQLHRSQREICNHIISSIDSLALHPFQGKPLKGNKTGCYSLRYTDYRIIYEIYPLKHTVHIIRIGHRRDVYR